LRRYFDKPDAIAAAKDQPIRDPDDLIALDMMDGRDGFLGMCRDDHREFSDLRKTRHSSLVLLHALHNADSADFSFSCNNCEKPIDAMDFRWHCTNSECQDFDLCEKCMKEVCCACYSCIGVSGRGW
jgi:hypothetical protein